jgi:hypothetical protein
VIKKGCLLLQPKREAMRKSGVTLAPVIDLKSKKDEEDSNSSSSFGSYNSGKVTFSGSFRVNMEVMCRLYMTVGTVLQCW